MTIRFLAPIAGVTALFVVVAGVVAVALSQWVLAASAVGVLGLGMIAVQLDTWRRVRNTRVQFRKELDRRLRSEAKAQVPGSVPTTSRPSVEEDDLRGALTMMQTQQAARLEGLQTALDLALADLADRRSDPSR